MEGSGLESAVQMKQSLCNLRIEGAISEAGKETHYKVTHFCENKPFRFFCLSDNVKILNEMTAHQTRIGWDARQNVN
jgi:hypothetical protein